MPSRMLLSSDATILSLPSTKYMSSIPRRYTLSPSSRSAALCYTLSPSVPVATPCLTSPVCGSLLLLIPLLLLRSPCPGFGMLIGHLQLKFPRLCTLSPSHILSSAVQNARSVLYYLISVQYQSDIIFFSLKEHFKINNNKISFILLRIIDTPSEYVPD